MLLACLVLLGACGDAEEAVVEASDRVISFSSDLAEPGQGLMRSATALASDFTVYGYKYLGTEEQAIFPGWTVQYDGPGSYNYIGVNGQTVRYWDPSATAYRFWASTGTGWTAGDKSLSIDNLPLRTGRTGSAAIDLSDDDRLYASLIRRDAPVDESTVALQFNRPYAQVSVLFYYEVMQKGVAGLQIKDVKLAPVAASGKVIYNQGRVAVSYPTTGTGSETVAVEGKSGDTRPAFDFVVPTALSAETGFGTDHAVQAVIPNHSAGLELPDMPGSDLAARGAPMATTRADAPQPDKFYYPLPMGDQNPDFELAMSISALDDQGDELHVVKRTAVIPAAYMHWKPNYAYRYYFKITEAALVVFADVKVDAWQYGGSQEDTWTNW